MVPSEIAATPLFDVFLSYNSRDFEAVEPIARGLRQQGLAPFLDRWYLAPGVRWRPKLEETLASCKAVAICVGREGMGSWQQREVDVALDRQSRSPQLPVIPVLLQGCEPPLGFLKQFTWVDLRSGPLEQGLALLGKAIRGEPAGPDLQQQFAATRAAICPYRGLLCFREEDASFFFGREASIRQLVAAVEQKSFLAVVGASGSGKSSVVRAGLVPQLRRARHNAWEIAALVPGNQPLKALAAALVPFLEPGMTETDRLVEVGKLAGHFAAKTVSLCDIVRRVLEKQSGTTRLLLVADQWEELYSPTQDDAARQRFMDELLEAATHAPLTVVLTLRGDFMGKALAYRPLSDRLQGAQINLGPMTRSELAQAVSQPAALMGLSFEHGLAERILDDVGDEPGNLPLLEFVLKELWGNRQGTVLLNQAYDDMDRLSGAIAKRAERFFGACSLPEQEAVHRLFLQLVHPGEEGRDTRRRAALADLPETSRALVKQLADERLLVTAISGESAEETAEVAHEALLRNWDRLKGWLNADREFLLWIERFRGLLGEWERAGRSDELLLRGPSLTEAERWQRECVDRLTASERDFIWGSTKARERRQEEERQRQQRELAQARALAQEQTRLAEERQHRARIQKRYTWVASTLLVGCAVLGAYLWKSRDVAQAASLRAEIATVQEKKATRIVFAGKLASRSQALLPAPHLDLALLLGAHALRLDNTLTNETPDLWESLAFPKCEFHFLQGHKKEVRSVAFSPDGKRLASVGWDGAVRLWDVEKCQPVATLLGNNAVVRSVVFSPDGGTLASGGYDGIVRLWDVATGRSGPPLYEHGTVVMGMAFSSDGKRLASVGRDGSVGLWDVASRKLLSPLSLGQSGIDAVAFSPDGKTLASGGVETLVRVWDMATGQQIGRPLQGCRGWVQCMAFSPNGKWLAAGYRGSAVIIWDVEKMQPVGAPLEGHSAEVHGVEFIDDRTLVSGSTDHTLMLWDLTPLMPPAVTNPPPVIKGTPLLGHYAEVHGVACHRKTGKLASASEDKTVILWDLATREPVGVPLRGHYGEVWSVAFSPDGRMVASGAWDAKVCLWDVVTRHCVANFQRPDMVGDHWVGSLAFGPDGRKLYSGWADGKIVALDIKTNQPAMEFLGHRTHVSGVALNPEGTTLASASWDGTVRLWDVDTRCQRGAPLLGHKDAKCLYRVNGVAFSPDGKTLASAGGDQKVILWKVETRQPVGTLMHSGSVYAVAFSPDGTKLASGSEDKKVILWDAVTRQRIATLKGHKAAVWSVVFSPDGKMLASGSTDNTAILWDVATLHPLCPPLSGHKDRIENLAFSPDGKFLASASWDSTVRLWSLHDQWLQFARRVARAKPDELINMAREVANRELTDREVGKYFGSSFSNEMYAPLAPELGNNAP